MIVGYDEDCQPGLDDCDLSARLSPASRISGVQVDVGLLHDLHER